MKPIAFDELIEEFDFLDSWEDRYRHIIELGDELDPMPAEAKTEETRVQGCISNVWLVAVVQAGPPQTVSFLADSDSQIVRGLAAMLLMLCCGRTPQEVLALDVEGLFNRLELSKHLSRSRSNGLHSMVKRIRQLAEQYS